MGASMPKQFLELCGKPMALHSLQIFMDLPCVHQIVVVCDESYEYVFREYAATSSSPPPANADSEHVPPPLEFARPGRERQDSVRNGLRVVHDEADLVAVHDSARPLVTPREVLAVVDDASLHGAAVLGVRSKATVKEVRSETDSDGSGGETHMVVRTLDRSTLWEMHTPQVIRPALLRKGYELVDRCAHCVNANVEKSALDIYIYIYMRRHAHIFAYMNRERVLIAFDGAFVERTSESDQSYLCHIRSHCVRDAVCEQGRSGGDGRRVHS